jgi:hypothetical protein
VDVENGSFDEDDKLDALLSGRKLLHLPVGARLGVRILSTLFNGHGKDNLVFVEAFLDIARGIGLDSATVRIPDCRVWILGPSLSLSESVPTSPIPQQKQQQQQPQWQRWLRSHTPLADAASSDVTEDELDESSH